MKATRCDRCGEYSEKEGMQHHTIDFKPKTPMTEPWPRTPSMKGIQIRIHMEPINYAGDAYMGLDLCVKCFKQTLREALTSYLDLDSPGLNIE